jgi:SAM-dependent methyltransferase
MRTAESADTPFHEMNPTGRFTDRVADYVRHRPTYPQGAIDAVLEGLGGARGLAAADVGAGTGISSRLLARRGVRVTAIEPNEAMRRAGEAEGTPGVEWRNGTAEATGMGDSAVDLVLCAQAFHWFEPGAALREFHRILKMEGRLAIMWNCRDRSDRFTAAYCRAIAEIGGESRVETKEFDAGTVAQSGLFGPVRMSVFPNEQRLDMEGLIGRALSASYSPKSGPGHERLLQSLRDLHGRCADGAGMVTLRYRTEVYLAERA